MEVSYSFKIARAARIVPRQLIIAIPVNDYYLVGGGGGGGGGESSLESNTR